jgi:hypothetical protein
MLQDIARPTPEPAEYPFFSASFPECEPCAEPDEQHAGGALEEPRSAGAAAEQP